MPYKSISEHSARCHARKHERRSKWFNENGPCRKCGSSERLELDHVDPSVKVTERVWLWSDSKREEELKKCQALCYCCHKVKTKSYWESIRKHGTRAMYKHGCRCQECRTANYLPSIKRRNKNRKNTYSPRKSFYMGDGAATVAVTLAT